MVTLYKISEVHFCLLGTNDFRVKAKNERFTAAGSLYCRKHIAPKSVPHVQYDYFSSFNPLKSLICGVVVAVVAVVIS